MTYLEKYKKILYRFIKENLNDGNYLSFSWDLDKNKLPQDLPHTLINSFCYDDYYDEDLHFKYDIFFEKYCIDIFVDDIINFINNIVNIKKIDRKEILDSIKSKFLFSYLINTCKLANNRTEIIKLFYNTII